MPVFLVMPVTEELVKLRSFQGIHHQPILSYASLPNILGSFINAESQMNMRTFQKLC